MGKGIGRVYKYSHQNWPYLSPNTTFVEPCGLFDSRLQVTAGKKSASPDNIIQKNPYQVLTTHYPGNDIIRLTDDLIPLKHYTNQHNKNMLDNNATDDDDSQYFQLL